MTLEQKLHNETCSDCDGRGYNEVSDNGEEVCDTCFGTGIVVLNEFGCRAD